MNKLFNLTITFLALGLLVLAPNITSAQTCDEKGNNFVDTNGDGFNDNAPDHDGDGIPNGLDEDYIKPEDGTGYQHQNKNMIQNSDANQFKMRVKIQKTSIK